MYYCDGPDIREVHTKIDCINKGLDHHWVNQKYNFDNLGQVRFVSPGHLRCLLHHPTLERAYVAKVKVKVPQDHWYRR